MRRQFRHEKKYLLSYQEYFLLKKRILPLTEPDPHSGSDGEYRISSLYFDSSDKICLKEKLDGQNWRSKLRIRYYNKDFTNIRLEVKHRREEFISKDSMPLRLIEFKKLIRGEYAFLKNQNNRAAEQAYIFLHMKGFKPAVMVDYHREARIYKHSKVRITFDRDINDYGRSRDPENRGSFSAYYPFHASQRLLEIKYNSFLPEILAKVLNQGHNDRHSFSKYAICQGFSPEISYQHRMKYEQSYL